MTPQSSNNILQERNNEVMNNRKRHVFCFLALLLSIAIVTNSTANTMSSREKELSSLSPNQCVDFCIAHGIQFPTDYQDIYIWGDFIQQVVHRVIEDPNYVFTIHYLPSLKLATEVKQLVNEYCSFNNPGRELRDTVSRYTLQYSIAGAAWNSSYSTYNCYAYAINQTWLGFLSPGYNSGNTYTINKSISTLADYVVADLQALGYTTAYKTTTAPTSGSHIICIRKGTYDFHLMKYEYIYWYHKPGATLPLRYIGAPSNSVNWTNEYIDSSGVAHQGTVIYDSTIYYIVY